MKETKEQNRGITLIALVITVVVMLLLVSVTISMAVNGGLFDYAGKAVGDTQNALDAEKELSNGRIKVDGKWYASIDDYIKGKVELPEGLKVGDYVNYTPTAGTYKVADGQYGSGYTTEDGYQIFTTETGENALKWRVLSIDEEKGLVELVAETPNSAKLYLQGADGYNHAVDILNDLCEELYSNENGAIARSINVEDINAKTTYDYTTYTNTTYGFKYGDTKQLSTYGTSYMKYPNLYSQEKGYGTAGTFNTTGLTGCEGLNDGVTDENGITTYSTVIGSTDGNIEGTDPYITYTYYSYTSENCLADLGINTVPSGLIKASKEYWLASHDVYARTNSAYFGVRYISPSGGVYAHALFYANGGVDYNSYAVRPVVSLNTNVSLTKDTTNSTEGTTYWDIEF